MLELKNITKIYKTKSESVRALDDVNLYFEEKGMVFISGKSGSGKTTLLNCIGGLDDFTSGEIIIKGRSVKDFSQSDYDSYRNTYIGFVFQEYNLLDNLTIGDNIKLATELQGVKDSQTRVSEILTQVDLSGIEKRKPQELSGGQRQRVAIARALVKNPSIIIADEPTGALDSANGEQVLTLLKKLSQDKLVIVVSHDRVLADRFADRIISLSDGRVESDVTISARDDESVNLDVNEERVLIRRGARLNEGDLSEIKHAVSAGKNIGVANSLGVVKRATEIAEKKKYDGSPAFIKTRLSFKDTLKLGLNTLKTKRVRLAITIILCAIAFSIFGMFDALAIYDENRLTANALKSSSTPAILMNSLIRESKNSSYEISVGDKLLTDLSAHTGYSVKGVYDSYYVGTTTPTELMNNNPYTISKYYYYKALRGVVEFDTDDIAEHGFSVIRGRLPQSYEEIAVSEYFANCMINWRYAYVNSNGDKVETQNIDQIVNVDDPLTLTIGPAGSKATYKIVGIVKTGEIAERFEPLKSNFEDASASEQNDLLNYVNNGYFLYGFVQKGFVSNALKQYNTLPKFVNRAYAYRFTLVDDISGKETVTTRENFYRFDDLKDLTSDYMFINADKTTLIGNEVLLDVRQFETIYADVIQCLKQIADNDEDFINHSIEIDNYLTILKGNGTAEDKLEAIRSAIQYMDEIQAAIDFTDGVTRDESVFNKNITVRKFDVSQYEANTSNLKEVSVKNKTYKIVGFYADVAVSPVTSFVLTDEGISNLGVNLSQGAYSSFIATNTGSGNINALSSVILNDSGTCFTCKNNAIAIIRANSVFFSRLSILFLIVSGVFAVFSIAMFANFITTSIKSKYSEIGILRALGASGVDILKMFVVETVVVALINAVLACVLSALGCLCVNWYLDRFLSIFISIAAFGWRQIGIILAMSVAVGLLSATIPIWSVSKQKPVETIRRAFK